MIHYHIILPTFLFFWLKKILEQIQMTSSKNISIYMFEIQVPIKLKFIY